MFAHGDSELREKKAYLPPEAGSAPIIGVLVHGFSMTQCAYVDCNQF